MNICNSQIVACVWLKSSKPQKQLPVFVFCNSLQKKKKRTLKFLLGKTFFLNETSSLRERTHASAWLDFCFSAEIDRSSNKIRKPSVPLLADIYNTTEIHSCIKFRPLINHNQYYSTQTQFDALSRFVLLSSFTSYFSLLQIFLLRLLLLSCLLITANRIIVTSNTYKMIFNIISTTKSNFLHQIRHFN